MLLEVIMTKKQKRPNYTLEFKQDAVKLVLEKGYTIQHAAESLGVSLSALSRWVRAEKGHEPKATSSQAALNLAERKELEELRKQNTQLQMERDILKKAAVFFAKENE